MKVFTVPEILGFLIKSQSAPLYELSSKNSKKDLPGTNRYKLNRAQLLESDILRAGQWMKLSIAITNIKLLYCNELVSYCITVATLSLTHRLE